MSPRAAPALLVGLLVLAACAGHRAKTEPPGPKVRRVEIEGAHVLDDDEVEDHLNLQRSRLGTPSYYLPGLEAVDRERITSLYESHGMYEAQVKRFEVEVERADRPVRRQRAKVHILIEEGPAVAVRHVEVSWVGAPVSAELRGLVRAAAKLTAGDRFGVAELEDARQRMVDALRTRGYAYADITERAWVEPEARLADVHFEISPDVPRTIEHIELIGLQRVPEDLVRRELKSIEGRRFHPARMREIESAIYGLEVFSVVAVDKAARREGTTMDIVVRVRETKMQRIKLGAGLGIDPVRWEQRATALYTHQNLGGRLWGLSVRAKAGYAELPAIYQPDEHGPIGALNVELRKKGLLERQLVWTEAPGFELGIWQGYQFYSVSNRLGVSRFFTRWFELGLSYNNRFVDLFGISPDLDRNRTVLGLDFRDPYVLSFLELVPTLHLTDQILRPSNGVRLSLPYAFSHQYLGSQFDYHRIEPDLRGYYRPHPRVQLAARARVGMLFPVGLRPGVPFDQKFYLGGSGDVRGWPLRHLSPRLSECADSDTTCTATPIGGRSMIQGSFELRVRTVADLWTVAFVDTGDVRAGVAQFELGGLMTSSGGGLRYDSPIGMFRLDVGVRLNDDPRFPEPRRWALHFGIGEAF